MSKQRNEFGSGSENPRWSGGVYVSNSSGYRFIRKPEHPNSDSRGYVREHVFVMSEHLGRKIESHEIVHHINEEKLDNRIENLEIMSRAEHTSHHHKGLHKPRSMAALKPGKTREQMLEIWRTTRSHEKRKPIECAWCKKEYTTKQQTSKYCCFDCYNQARRSR